MIETIIDIPTRDGLMETFICRPERGAPAPAVFMLMDAPGIRVELHDMARRLATVGYAVLLPNLYYRAGLDTKYDPATVLEEITSSCWICLLCAFSTSSLRLLNKSERCS